MVAPNAPELQQPLALARNAAETTYDLLAAGRFAGRDPVVHARVMLAATLADALHAVIAVVASPGQAHAHTIIRSMLEALGNLHHLGTDPNYLERLTLTSALEVEQANAEFIKRRWDSATDYDRRIVAVAKQRQAEAQQEITKLRTKGVTRLTVRGRIAAAGVPTELPAIYHIQCADAHHDLSALVRRHSRGNEIRFGGDTFSLADACGALGLATSVVSLMVDALPSFGTFDEASYQRTKAIIDSSAAELMAIYNLDAARRLAQAEGNPSGASGNANSNP